MIKNILDSVRAVSKRGKIEYVQFRKDIIDFCKEEGIEMDFTRIK